MCMLTFVAPIVAKGSPYPEGIFGCAQSGAPLESGLAGLGVQCLWQIQSMSPGLYHPGLPIWVAKMHVAEQAAAIRPPWLGGAPIPCAVQQLSGVELGGLDAGHMVSVPSVQGQGFGKFILFGPSGE